MVRVEQMRRFVITDQYRHSRIAEFVPGERHDDRHQRRYDIAMDSIAIIAKWCEFRGVLFRVSGRSAPSITNHVFKFTRPLVKDAAIGGWNPARGWAWKSKSARNEKPVYVKVHDWQQLLDFLNDVFV
jgi:hypothetical protein